MMDSTSQGQVIIRKGVLEDANGIAEVHLRSWKATYPGMVSQMYLDSLNLPAFNKRWEINLAPTSHMIVYVAEQDGVIQGFASGGEARENMPGYTSELFAIYLSQALQGQRIGSRLFRAVAHEAMDRGLKSMFVWVLKENPSRSFYEGLGGSLIVEKNREVGGEEVPQVAYGWTSLSLLAL